MIEFSCVHDRPPQAKNPVLEIHFWKQSASRDDDENARECAKISILLFWYQSPPG